MIREKIEDRGLQPNLVEQLHPILGTGMPALEPSEASEVVTAGLRPIGDRIISEDGHGDENRRENSQPYRLNAVRSPPERVAKIASILPPLDFGKLKRPPPSQPKRDNMVYSTVNSSMAWPSIFADVSLPAPPKSMLRSGPAKGDTLDFLSRLELVESLDAQHDSASSTEACGSAPPHYKGSPMKSVRGGKGGFMDDTRLLSTPVHGSLVKPPKAKKAKKGAAAKKKKKTP